MVIHKCPNCGKRYSVMEHSGDYVHNCNDFPENTTLSKEDVVAIATTGSDFDGSFTRNKPLLQGAANKLMGTDADIDGDNLDDTTRRGSRKSTHRTRSKYTYIDGADKPIERDDLTYD